MDFYHLESVLVHPNCLNQDTPCWWLCKTRQIYYFWKGTLWKAVICISVMTFSLSISLDCLKLCLWSLSKSLIYCSWWVTGWTVGKSFSWLSKMNCTVSYCLNCLNWDALCCGSLASTTKLMIHSYRRNRWKVSISFLWTIDCISTWWYWDDLFWLSRWRIPICKSDGCIQSRVINYFSGKWVHFWFGHIHSFWYFSPGFGLCGKFVSIS